MAFLTDKFFESPVYRALQAPYNERMARERAASNPLAPSQGGSWPSPRPVSTALTPQNYTPNIPPHIPNDPRRATADMRVPGMVGPAPGAMQPFPLAYPDNAPIDITVRGGNVANVPLPQRRPWDAPTSMDLAAIAARDAAMQPPVATAYAPPPSQNPAVAAAAGAAQGQPPQTSVIQDIMTGINSLLPNNAPKPLNPSQSYDATNAAAAEAARNQDRSGVGSDGYVRDASGNVTGRADWANGMSPSQQYDFANGAAAFAAGVRDRSGIGTDGYVRDASGQVIGRDPKYAGLSPSQMYDAINGNGPRPGTPGTDRNGNRIDGNPDNHTFSGDSRHKWNFGQDRPKGNGQPRYTVGPTQAPRPMGGGGQSGMRPQPVTLGPMQRPQQPGTGGPMLAPSRSIAPVSGGIMAPAQRRRSPIMRSA